MELDCLSCRSKSKDKEPLMEVQEEVSVIRLPYESTETIKGYENYVQKIFKYLSLLHDKPLKPIILNLVFGVQNDPYWGILLHHLRLNIKELRKIDSIDLSAGTFTLKHLQDCHSLFKLSQKMNTGFPVLHIAESQAAFQFTEKEDILPESKLNDYSVEDPNRLTEDELSKLLGGRGELFKDISKQQFLRSLEADNDDDAAVNESFMKIIELSEGVFLYNFLKHE